MILGTKEFTQAASSEYKSITVDEKEKLRQRCEGLPKSSLPGRSNWKGEEFSKPLL